MNPQEIIAIMQLVAALTPLGMDLASKIITAFESSDMSIEDRQKMIDQLAATLKPMTEK